MRKALLLFVIAAGCTRTSGEPAGPLPDPTRDPAVLVTTAPPETPAPAAASAPPANAAPGQPAPAGAAGAEPGESEIDARFVPLMAAAFRDYKAWGRVDDELRWAPWLCRLPLPGRARMSAADDGDHARKLYSVFARHRDRYPLSQGGARVDQPADQVLVKESFHPEPVARAEPGLNLHDRPLPDGTHFDPVMRDGDRLYRASRLAGLYVVMKLPPGTPGTDAGWIYGTVTPSGEVTSAGRVASCMGCHVSARHERVFGLNPEPEAAR
jgi:hypothetical protein